MHPKPITTTLLLPLFWPIYPHLFVVGNTKEGEGRRRRCGGRRPGGCARSGRGWSRSGGGGAAACSRRASRKPKRRGAVAGSARRRTRCPVSRRAPHGRSCSRAGRRLFRGVRPPIRRAVLQRKAAEAPRRRPRVACAASCCLCNQIRSSFQPGLYKSSGPDRGIEQEPVNHPRDIHLHTGGCLAVQRIANFQDYHDLSEFTKANLATEEIVATRNDSFYLIC
ncbi:uncharacterized protein LOC107305331 [Oryza brachyantha]|uniref:uncharacterized protein LOC107305331 n=1 Tax=Oryza brachyantha TaxID=4533 RepID=UPI001ADCD8C7|nr:uncharacterized protein LOC107305331 [Oryza brachyantha]